MSDKPMMRAEDVLLSQESALAQKFNALFHLEGRGTVDDARTIEQALLQSTHSDLLRHELAYALGQMQHTQSIPVLTRLLHDNNEAGIVRHEAAEALGAIGTSECVQPLRAHLESSQREVAETCELALARIAACGAASDDDGAATAATGVRGEQGSLKEQRASEFAHANGESPFLSVDPVPAWPASTSLQSLQQVLLNESKPMWDRYRSMFALRNKGNVDSAKVLAHALRQSSSALLKHEVAYVLGQMQERDGGAPEALEASLQDPTEHPMVRHEAAEALGSVCPAERVKPLLQKMAYEASEPVVSESCDVAIGMLESTA